MIEKMDKLPKLGALHCCFTTAALMLHYCLDAALIWFEKMDKLPNLGPYTSYYGALSLKAS